MEYILAHLQHCPSDVLSKGSYTCSRPGYLTTILGNEVMPVGNPLFAGEHTNFFYEWQGFMERAANSGIRAAKEALATVGGGGEAEEIRRRGRPGRPFSLFVRPRGRAYHATMRQHPSLAGAQGFTLIELLVALTLMGLVSVILFGGLRFGVRAWEAGGGHIDQASRVEIVQSLLRRQLSQTRLPPQAANAGPVASFVGEPGGLAFIAPLPAHRGIGGSYLFHLSDSERDGRSDLTLAWHVYRPELLASDPSMLENGTTLLEDIAEVKLSYFGAPDPEQAPQWWDAWDGINGAPQLVRVRVEFPPGDSRRWPDLIVRVLASSN